MLQLDLLSDNPVVRATTAVYTTLTLQVMFLVAASPGLLLLWLLVPDPSNVGLGALSLLPVGPALSACLFGWRVRRFEVGLRPARDYWRGWRLNLGAVLRWWVPACLGLALLGTNLVHLDAVAPGGPARTGLRTALVGLTVLLLMVMTHALVTTSLFTLRTRDVLRLALHHLARFPLLTLRTASVLLLAAAVVVLSSELVLGLLTSLLCLLLLHNARPLITDIEENYLS